MTLQERQLIYCLRWWVGFFAAATVLFAAFPFDVIYWLNNIGHAIFRWPYKSLGLPNEHFWQILAVSLLATLTYIAAIAQSDIRQNLSYVKLIIVAKFVSSAGFLTALVITGPYFVYLVGAVIDFLIFAITLFCYRRTVVSRGL